eukprot:5116796-Prymnesium_polylepis.1
MGCASVGHGLRRASAHAVHGGEGALGSHRLVEAHRRVGCVVRPDGQLRRQPDLVARHARRAHRTAHLALGAVEGRRVDVPDADLERVEHRRVGLARSVLRLVAPARAKRQPRHAPAVGERDSQRILRIRKRGRLRAPNDDQQDRRAQSTRRDRGVREAAFANRRGGHRRQARAG